MKKIIIAALIVCMVGLVIWLSYASFNTLKEKEAKREVRTEAVTSVPALSFMDLDGVQNRLDKVAIDHPLILILFNPECEHCQYEAQDISSNITSFENTKLVFISSESLDDIKKFANAYSLNNLPNVSFGQADMGDMIELFQRITYPNIFIYNSEGKLEKEFTGEAKVELLLNY